MNEVLGMVMGRGRLLVRVEYLKITCLLNGYVYLNGFLLSLVVGVIIVKVIPTTVGTAWLVNM